VTLSANGRYVLAGYGLSGQKNTLTDKSNKSLRELCQYIGCKLKCATEDKQDNEQT